MTRYRGRSMPIGGISIVIRCFCATGRSFSGCSVFFLVLFDVVPINVSKYFKMYIVELFKKDGFSVVQFVNTNLILGVSTTKK